MTIPSIRRIGVTTLLILAGYTISTAQLSITGAQCILPGTTYPYLLTGSRNSPADVKVCITGGRLASGDVCTQDSLHPNQVFVIWDDTATVRNIMVSSSAGNASMTVVATSTLTGGKLQDADRAQTYGGDSTALFTFRCTDASGGSCSPNYFYKWQRSDNALNWADIPGATGKDLQWAGNVKVNTFFRRTTVEGNSTSIAYSDNAVLTVNFNR